VLIDTAGRSPRDEPRIHELRELLEAARVDETHLVLSVTSGVKTLESVMQQFAPARPTSMILSKLDEVGRLGSLLGLLRQSPLPVSYITTGQDVPDDIEPAQAARLARCVLSAEIPGSP